MTANQPPTDSQSPLSHVDLDDDGCGANAERASRAQSDVRSGGDATKRDLAQTVMAAIGGRLWQFLSGPLTVYLIGNCFSEIEQGWFYAFAGYLGMQAFFELGLAGVLISVAGHEQAAIDSPNAAEAERGRGLLTDLTRKSLRVYSLASFLFLLITGSSGYLFFARQALDAPTLHWQWPWLTLMVVATINLLLTPVLAILEGTGKARLVYRSRFLQAILGSLAVWVSLLAGLSLWTAVVSAAVQMLVQLWLVLGPGRAILVALQTPRDPSHSIRWRKTVLPLQWRIALQGIALYLATQALTLVLVETQNVKVAGQWGMTWSILLALQSMAIAWINAGFPAATRLAATKKVADLRRYWLRISAASAGLLMLGLTGFAGTLLGLDALNIPLSQRFISASNVLIFGIGMVAYHFAACLGYLVRAQKRESLYAAATVGQLVVAALCWGASLLGGVDLLCAAYATANLFVLLPLHIVAYRIDSSRNDQNNV